VLYTLNLSVEQSLSTRNFSLVERAMGANASNEINAAAMQSLSIINNQTQECVTVGSQQEVIDICVGRGCGLGSSVDISGINFAQSAVYTTQCNATINITDDIRQMINQDFSQAATAIAQQFQLSAANVNNTAQIAATVADSITTETVQRCTQTASQTAGIVINCNEDGSGPCMITIRQVNFDQGFTPINNCILQDTQVQGVVNQVTQTIQQQATAKVESIFGPLGFVILIILVIVGYTFYKGENALTDWRLWVVVIVIVLIYLGIAFYLKWFPFETKSTN
jgi:type IV secretory pathway VirB2 component (pilin)